MPRPRKPTVPKSESPFVIERLDEDTVKYFAEYLGIKKDQKRIKDMTRYVEMALSSYWYQIENKAPTIGSRIAFIKCLEKSARALFENYCTLAKDHCTRGLLYGFAASYLDLEDEAEFVSDFEAAKGIYGSIRDRLKDIKSRYKTRGAPQNWSLRNTIASLSEIFDRYDQNNNSRDKEQRRAQFIDLALDAADIRHPDIEQTRFHRLLKPILSQSPKQ